MNTMTHYKRILLIDDDADDQELFQLALDKIDQNIQCKVMASAKEALRFLEEESVTADLIFLDLNMPLMTGQQFLSELKKRPNLCEIPIVVLSTSSDKETIEQAKSLGAMKFFTKPSDFNELKEIIQNLLN